MKRLTPGGASHRFANEMGYPACQCITRGQVCQTASQGKRLSQWLGRLADCTRPAGSEDVSFHQKFEAIRGQVRNIDRQSRGDCARGLQELRIMNYELRSKTAKKLFGRTNPSMEKELSSRRCKESSREVSAHPRRRRLICPISAGWAAGR